MTRMMTKLTAVLMFLLLLYAGSASATILEGTVYGGASPLDAATVSLRLSADKTVVNTMTTNAAGHYSFDVASGTYDLLVAPSTTSGFASTGVNGITVGATAVTQNVVLIANASVLSGVVRDGKGAPISNIQLTINEQASGTAVGTVVSDAQGNYSIGLANGTYEIDIQSVYGKASSQPRPDYFVVWPLVMNLAVSGNTSRDLTLPFVTLSGKTTDSNGVAVSGVEVKADKYWSNSSTSYFQFRQVTTKTVSDAGGNYSLVLLSGLDSVTLTPPTNTGLAATVVTGLALTADAQRNFALSALSQLSGVVRDGKGAPISNIQLTINEQASGTAVGTVLSDAQGNYSIGLANGTYEIDIQSVYGKASSQPRPDYFVVWPLVMNLAVSGNTGRDLALPFVTLNGKTTDSNGVAVSGVEVKADKYWSNSSTSYFQFRQVTTKTVSDAGGNYSIVLLSGLDSIAITPPLGSGFAQTVLSKLNLTSSSLLAIILDRPDHDAPIILSGPSIRAISASSAVVEWQTNEPARGSVKVGSVTVTATDLSTTQSVLITGLTASTPYTTEVSATDASGNGPSFKNATFTTAATPDTAAPVILEGPAITASTNTTLVVEWTTSEPAKGSLGYGIAGLTSSVTETVFAIQHRMELTGLSANTQYQVQVNATDAAGNGPTLSRIATGRTQPTPDTIAPVITNGPLVSDITDNMATVTWKTDEPATSGVSWNDGVAYGVLTDTVPSTDHRAQITGLVANTAYHLTVSSTDALGNGPSLSKTVDFTTQALADTAPPQILGAPTIVTITHQSAVIRWDTDEPADGQVSYGILSLNKDESRTALIKKHTIPLVGLAPATTYQFKVSSKDAAGNTSSSTAIYTFTTLAKPDIRIPVFDTPPTVGYSSDDKAVIKWKTDKQTDSQVTVTSVTFEEPPKIKSEGKLGDEHEVSLTGLTPNNTYSVSVTSTDSEGNKVSQSLGNFSTPPMPDSLAPVITGTPTAQSIGATSVTLTWATDKLSNSTVKYGPSGATLGQSAGDISYTRQHSVVLTKLKHSTAYQFQASSTDPSGNIVQSAVISFSTAAKADTTAPTLGIATVRSITASAATIEWTTDEPSTSSISYGTTALDQKLEDTALVSTHSMTLTGLSPSTSYKFTVSSSDASGNKASSASTQGFDTTAPQVLTLSSIAITGAASVDAGASVTYSATATYSDSSTAAVSPSWSIPGTGASVNASTGQLTADSVSTLQTVTLTASYQGSSVQKTIEIRPVTTGQTTVSYTASFPDGWTLAGNGLATAINVPATFGATGIADKVTTVWSWNATTSTWSFYSPVLSATQLADYAASKGYGVLSSIEPRQGYWVNANVPVDLPARAGLPVALATSDLVAGWNLVGQGVEITPANFNRSLSGAAAGTTPSNFTSLWAWDNMNGAWYFYAPSLDALGGSALSDYIISKHYMDFGTQGKMLNLDSGFWVNLQ